MIERRIMKHATLLEQLFVERLVVVSHHLSDDGQLRVAGLKNHLSASTLASCASCHLRHHHESMLVGTEVRIVEHGVGIENAHHRHVAEVETLAHHLCAYEQVGGSRREFVYDTFVCIACTGGVEIHPRHTCLGEYLAYAVLNVLRAIAPRAQLSASATRTFGRHIIHTATVMARKPAERLV